MINSDLQGAKVCEFAQLKPECARLYPGLRPPDAWFGVLNRGAKLGGVFLAVTPRRFVWRQHFTFRNIPPPG